MKVKVVVDSYHNSACGRATKGDVVDIPPKVADRDIRRGHVSPLSDTDAASIGHEPDVVSDEVEDEEGVQEALEQAQAELEEDRGDGTESFTCAGEKSDGSECTREVDSEGEHCWQHEDQA